MRGDHRAARRRAGARARKRDQEIFAAATAAIRATSVICIERPPNTSPVPYGEDEFWQDLWGVTGGATNEHLARLTIRESETLGDWMRANGVRWQSPLRGTLHLARTNLFMLGGGKAMMNAYYDTRRKARRGDCLRIRSARTANE